MPPVFAAVVHTLPNHLHDLGEGDNIVGQVGDLAHLSTEIEDFLTRTKRYKRGAAKIPFLIFKKKKSQL